MTDEPKVNLFVGEEIVNADCMTCDRPSKKLTGITMKTVDGKIIPISINGRMHHKIFICEDCISDFLNFVLSTRECL